MPSDTASETYLMHFGRHLWLYNSYNFFFFLAVAKSGFYQFVFKGKGKKRLCLTEANIELYQNDISTGITVKSVCDGKHFKPVSTCCLFCPFSAKM